MRLAASDSSFVILKFCPCFPCFPWLEMPCPAVVHPPGRRNAGGTPPPSLGRLLRPVSLALSAAFCSKPLHRTGLSASPASSLFKIPVPRSSAFSRQARRLPPFVLRTTSLPIPWVRQLFLTGRVRPPQAGAFLGINQDSQHKGFVNERGKIVCLDTDDFGRKG